MNNIKHKELKKHFTDQIETQRISKEMSKKLQELVPTKYEKAAEVKEALTNGKIETDARKIVDSFNDFFLRIAAIFAEKLKAKNKVEACPKSL